MKTAFTTAVIVSVLSATGVAGAAESRIYAPVSCNFDDDAFWPGYGLLRNNSNSTKQVECSLPRRKSQNRLTKLEVQVNRGTNCHLVYSYLKSSGGYWGTIYRKDSTEHVGSELRKHRFTTTVGFLEWNTIALECDVQPNDFMGNFIVRMAD